MNLCLKQLLRVEPLRPRDTPRSMSPVFLSVVRHVAANRGSRSPVRAAVSSVVLGAAAFGCLMFTAPGTSIAAEPRYLVMDPPIVYPGAVVRVMANAPSWARSGWIEVDGQRCPGYFEQGLFTSYCALDVNTVIGPYRMDYAIGRVRGSRMVTVRPRKFVERVVSEPPTQTRLDRRTLEFIARDDFRLDRLWDAATPKRLWAKSFAVPSPGMVSQPFGLRRVFEDTVGSPHSGVDIEAPAGARVRASNTGHVVFAESQYFLGNVVVIDHGLGLYTIYAHLGEIYVVPGQGIAQGHLIGRVGETGRVTHPHLHFGVRLLQARVDPITLPGMQLEILDEDEVADVEGFVRMRDENNGDGRHSRGVVERAATGSVDSGDPHSGVVEVHW